MIQLFTQWMLPTGILTLGVIEDVRFKKIRNQVLIGCLLASLVFMIFSGGFGTIPTGLLSLLVALGLGFPLFLLGVLGAGDVKLLMVFSLTQEWSTIFFVSAVSMIWGSLLGVIQITLKKDWSRVRENMGSLVWKRKAPSPGMLHHIPFAVALLFAWLTHLTLIQSGGHWL